MREWLLLMAQTRCTFHQQPCHTHGPEQADARLEIVFTGSKIINRGSSDATENLILLQIGRTWPRGHGISG